METNAPSKEFRGPRSPDERRSIELLGEEIAELSTRIDTVTHRLLTRLRAFDEVRGWEAQGAKTAAHWLSWRTGMGMGAARERVRVARALATLPRIDEALCTGRISFAKARAITRVASTATEELLLDHALATTAARLERICNGMRFALANETPRRDVDRYVRHWTTDSGMVRIEIQLPGDEGAIVLKALEAARFEATPAPTKQTRAVEEPSPLAEGSVTAESDGGDPVEEGVSAETHRRDPVEEGVSSETHRRGGAEVAISAETPRRGGAEEAISVETHRRGGVEGAISAETHRRDPAEQGVWPESPRGNPGEQGVAAEAHRGDPTETDGGGADHVMWPRLREDLPSADWDAPEDDSFHGADTWIEETAMSLDLEPGDWGESFREATLAEMTRVRPAAARADGLLLLAERFLDAKAVASPASPRFEITVVVDQDSLNGTGPGAALLDDEIGVSAETARRISCDAPRVHILVDSNGDALDVGRRTRSIPPAMRRALGLRDRGCRFPTCTNRHFVDGHHIRHWAQGGETKLDNLVLVCRRHHRAVHEEGFKVAMENGQPVFSDRFGNRIANQPTALEGISAETFPTWFEHTVGSSNLDPQDGPPLDSFELSATVGGLVDRELGRLKHPGLALGQTVDLLEGFWRPDLQR